MSKNLATLENIICKKTIIFLSLLICMLFNIANTNLAAKDLGFYVGAGASYLHKNSSVYIDNSASNDFSGDPSTAATSGFGLDFFAGYGFDLGSTIIGPTFAVTFDNNLAETEATGGNFGINTIKYKPTVVFSPGFFIGKPLGDSMLYLTFALDIRKNKFDVLGNAGGTEVKLEQSFLDLFDNTSLNTDLSYTPTIGIGYTYSLNNTLKLYFEGSINFTPETVAVESSGGIPDIAYKQNSFEASVGVIVNLQ